MEYNPNTDTYWDESALAQDMKTAFDICNGCRLCFSLCPSFPDLFKSVEAHDDNVDLLTDEEMARPADLCYQCKLCYMKCPYIPPHRFDLDFPRLMLRSKAIRAKKEWYGTRGPFPWRSGTHWPLRDGCADIVQLEQSKPDDETIDGENYWH